MWRKLKFLAMALALAPCAAVAAPRSIKDCERIKQADAYNACLARFGPPVPGLAMREKEFSKGKPTSVIQAPAIPPSPALRRARRRARRGHAVRRKTGRVRTVIEMPAK